MVRPGALFTSVFCVADYDMQYCIITDVCFFSAHHIMFMSVVCSHVESRYYFYCISVNLCLFYYNFVFLSYMLKFSLTSDLLGSLFLAQNMLRLAMSVCCYS